METNALLWTTEKRRVKDLLPFEINPRVITEDRRERLASLLQKFNLVEIPAVNLDNTIIAGNQRVKVLALVGRGEDYIDVRIPNRLLTVSEVKEYALTSNTHAGQWDYELLQTEFSEFNLSEFDIEMPKVEFDMNLPDDILADRPSLADRFVIPPFSVFDSRQGYWQDRKRKWHNIGIASQATREEIEIMAKSSQSPAIYDLRNKMRAVLNRDPTWEEILEKAKEKGQHVYQGASIFDPVLCEIAYRWFCPANGIILDPFAGGSVRGIVAGKLKFSYVGIDLREDQVVANRDQASRAILQGEVMPEWITGDSLNLSGLVGDLSADFVFSCPPYHDLEVYSEDPADLSNMDYDTFIDVYRQIIFDAVAKLKPNRFACFIVGDIRDRSGIYRNFVGDSIKAFQDAGMGYYNDIVLINVAGSLPIRAGRQFSASRKVGKMHQNVLIFYKGDQAMIRKEFPVIEIDNSILDET